MRRRSGQRVESTVADECQTFLHGTLAEYEGRRGRLPTAWMVLNLPAHGTRDQLRAATAVAADANRWQRARSYLCSEVLDVAEHGPMSLEDLQDRVLVPLELATCNNRLKFSTTLGGVVSCALDALTMCRTDAL